MEVYKENEQAHYDAHYARTSGVIDRELKETVLKRSEAFFRQVIERACNESTILLEVGCGVSPVVFDYGLSNRLTCLAEISFEALRSIQASKVDEDSTCVSQMDAEQLGFCDEVFDVVINNEFLSSVKPKVALSELFRVLKPGGILIAKETLQGNPIFQWHRRRKVEAGEMHEWVAQHIFRYDYLEEGLKRCTLLEAQSFHLFAVLGAPLVSRLPESLFKRVCCSMLDGLDRFILTLPGLKSLGFKTIFIVQKAS